MSAVAVLGAGSWGTTLALHLARLGHAVYLWEFDPRRAQQVADSRLSLPFLPEHRLPPAIAVTSELSAVLTPAATVVLAVPSHTVRGVGDAVRGLLGDVAQRVGAERVWVSATKGIEEESGLTPRALFSRSAGMPERSIVVLAGPSFAADVAAQRPTAILAAATDMALAERVQSLFASDAFRVYTSPDPLGVEIAVALKNVIAIAAGIATGLELGRNAMGALVTRGLAEIMRLGVRCGAQPQTFLGLAGIGDLVITCTSTLSRNYRVGIGLAQRRPLGQILDELQMVAEGVRTCRAAVRLAQGMGVELPIATQVYAVLFEDRDPRDAVLELMRRPLKAEFGGLEG